MSATNRETTRVLLDKIAERLKDRWEQARTVPSYEVEAEEADADADAGGDAALPEESESESMTTLAEMTAGKRYRRTTLRI